MVTQELFGSRQVAKALGVSDVVVNLWIRERPWGGEYGIPEPVAKTRHGNKWRYLWSETGVERWRDWLRRRIESDRQWRSNRYDGSRSGALERLENV